jgi:tetratricopeptide (TPR) repeat protein
MWYSGGILLFGQSFFSTSAFAQTDCTDWYLKKMRKAIKKANCSKKGHLIYELAQCYKVKNDSTYKDLLKNSINAFRSCYDHPPRQDKIKYFFVCGEISYVLHDYVWSETYYERAFISLDQSTQVRPVDYYCFGLVKYDLKKYDDAIKAFETYKSLMPNDHSLDSYLDKARTEKNGR